MIGFFYFNPLSLSSFTFLNYYSSHNGSSEVSQQVILETKSGSSIFSNWWFNLKIYWKKKHIWRVSSIKAQRMVWELSSQNRAGCVVWAGSYFQALTCRLKGLSGVECSCIGYNIGRALVLIAINSCHTHAPNHAWLHMTHLIFVLLKSNRTCIHGSSKTGDLLINE